MSVTPRKIAAAAGYALEGFGIGVMIGATVELVRYGVERVAGAFELERTIAAAIAELEYQLAAHEHAERQAELEQPAVQGVWEVYGFRPSEFAGEVARLETQLAAADTRADDWAKLAGERWETVRELTAELCRLRGMPLPERPAGIAFPAAADDEPVTPDH